MRLLGPADFNGDKKALERYYKDCQSISSRCNDYRNSLQVIPEKNPEKEDVTFTRWKGTKKCGTTTSLGFELKPGKKIEAGELPSDYYDNMGGLEI